MSAIPSPPSILVSFLVGWASEVREGGSGKMGDGGASLVAGLVTVFCIFGGRRSRTYDSKPSLDPGSRSPPVPSLSVMCHEQAVDTTAILSSPTLHHPSIKRA